MKNESGNLQRIVNFFEGKGFYIILILCLAAIGVSAYVLFFSVDQDIPDITPIDYLVEEPVWTPAPPESLVGNGDVTETGGKTEVIIIDPTPSIKPSISPSISPSPKTEDKPASATANIPADTAPDLYVWPVKGKVLVPFAKDELIYDETMGDWRAHLGIDIEAAMNAKVVAIADGKVVDVYMDDMYGSTVIIQHGGGIRSIYANLNKKPAVIVGQQVKTGDVLGSVSDTAIGEWGIDSHMHFEMVSDGQFVNPLNYLPNAN